MVLVFIHCLFQASAVRPRRMNYQRKKGEVATVATEVVLDIDADDEEVSVTGADVEVSVTGADGEVSVTGADGEVSATSATGEETELPINDDTQLQLDIEFLNSICDADDNDSFCNDFQDMDSNFMSILEFSRSA